ATEQLREILKSGQSDREILSAITVKILESRSEDQALPRLFIYSALENHQLSHRLFRIYVAEYYEALTDYIRQRIAEGVFRKVNPAMAARGFLGMVVYHSWIQELYGGKRYQDFSVKEVSETFAELWLQGMLDQPKNENSKTRATSKNGNHRNGTR